VLGPHTNAIKEKEIMTTISKRNKERSNSAKAKLDDQPLKSPSSGNVPFIIMITKVLLERISDD